MLILIGNFIIFEKCRYLKISKDGGNLYDKMGLYKLMVMIYILNLKVISYGEFIIF